jgi:peptidoglycan/xylan/chitin deacetylase (PgdA/CDA1 family)
VSRTPRLPVVLLAIASALVGCTSGASPSAVETPGAGGTPAVTIDPAASSSSRPTQRPVPSEVPTPVPTPVPTALPTVLPTASTLPSAPAPTRPPGPPPPSTIVSHGDRSSALVALTFDMGGRAEPVLPIMTWLRDNRVPATIFVAGSVIDSPWTDVGRKTVEMMEADPDLFEMASHGYGHPDMRTQSAEEIAGELVRTEETLARLGARMPQPLFRPPSGYQDALVLRVAGEHGYRWTVLWDVDPLDWKTVQDGGPTAGQIVTKVVGSAQGGSIVLLHLSGTQTLEALPALVSGLRAKGLRIVLLGELLGR